MFCWNKLNLQTTLLVPGHLNRPFRPFTNTDLTFSGPTVSVKYWRRARRGPTQVVCDGEPETLPALHWKHLFGSEEQKEGSERCTTPFLFTCKPISGQGSTFWKHRWHLQGSLYKESDSKIRTSENYFEGILRINSFDHRERKIFWLKTAVSCFSENSTDLFWILLLKSRSGKIIWQKQSQRYGKVETITLHNSGDTIHTVVSVTGAGQCQLVETPAAFNMTEDAIEYRGPFLDSRERALVLYVQDKCLSIQWRSFPLQSFSSSISLASKREREI